MILVVIDDLDRLDAGEVQLILKLVKTNADFPRFIYLLLFDRLVVEECLNSITAGPGSAFLGKIVQLSVDVPLIEISQVHKALFAGLDKLLDHKRFERGWDKIRWGNVFDAFEQCGYFSNLRDVKRYLNGLQFHLPLLVKGGVFEVNIVDFLAVEALRQFEPNFHLALRDSKEVLTTFRAGKASADEPDVEQEQMKSIVERAAPNNHGGIRELLGELFPQKRWMDGGPEYGHQYLEDWFRELRIAHPAHFEKYFLLRLPEGTISQAELDRIVSLAGDREALVAYFRVLKQRGLLDIAMERLEAYKQRISIFHAESFVTAMFDIGDDLADLLTAFPVLSASDHADRIVYWFLKQEIDPLVRFNVLMQSIQSTSGLYLPVRRTMSENNQEARNKDPNRFLTPLEKAPLLKEACVQNIRKAAKNNYLSTNQHLQVILIHWFEWDPDQASVKTWVDEFIQPDAGLIAFLKAFLSRSIVHTGSDHVGRERWRMRLSYFEKFVDLNMLKSRLLTLPTDNLGLEEKRAVEACKKSLKRREQGKPEDDLRDLYDDDE